MVEQGYTCIDEVSERGVREGPDRNICATRIDHRNAICPSCKQTPNRPPQYSKLPGSNINLEWGEKPRY